MIQRAIPLSGLDRYHAQPLGLVLSCDSLGGARSGDSVLSLGYWAFPICDGASALLYARGGKTLVTSVRRKQQVVVVGKSFLQGMEAPICC